jgi:hypothetical protein
MTFYVVKGCDGPVYFRTQARKRAIEFALKQLYSFFIYDYSEEEMLAVEAATGQQQQWDLLESMGMVQIAHTRRRLETHRKT